VVQQPAEFPGGLQGWSRYLERTLNRDLPVENGAPAGKYAVTVSFVVSRDGSISDVKAENNPGYGTSDEAVRVITRGPKWKPAVQNGRNVIYRHRQAVIFMVSED
jgi:protein TonB